MVLKLGAILFVGGLVGKAFGGSNSGQVKSKTEKLTPVVSQVSVRHLRIKAALVGSLSEKKLL